MSVFAKFAEAMVATNSSQQAMQEAVHFAQVFPSLKATMLCSTKTLQRGGISAPLSRSIHHAFTHGTFAALAPVCRRSMVSLKLQHLIQVSYLNYLRDKQ
jgi:hypothetical protein